MGAAASREITEEQYDEFYKHVAHDFEPPLAYTHNRVEGRSEYTQLLFIPAQGAVRPVGPRQARRHQALRQARLHHGRRRAADAGVPALRPRRDRLERPAAQRLARDPAGSRATSKAIREGVDQARAGAARGSGRQRRRREGQVRDVLEGVRPRAQGRHRRGSRPTASASPSCCASPRRTTTATSRPSRSPTTSAA